MAAVCLSFPSWLKCLLGESYLYKSDFSTRGGPTFLRLSVSPASIPLLPRMQWHVKRASLGWPWPQVIYTQPAWRHQQPELFFCLHSLQDNLWASMSRCSQKTVLHGQACLCTPFSPKGWSQCELTRAQVWALISGSRQAP